MTDADRSAKGGPGWLGHPDSVPPTVLILGGFLTAPPMYRPLVGGCRIAARPGAVVVRTSGRRTGCWPASAASGRSALAPAKALREAIRLSAKSRRRAAARHRPLRRRDHGRLLTAPEPIPGRRFGAARWIGAIVTLGTPHRLGRGRGDRPPDQRCGLGHRRRVGSGRLLRARDRLPVRGLARVRGDPAGTGRERVAHLLYRSVIGRAAVPGTEGDGLVPVVAAAP
jgi:hypothetical protein